MGGYFGARLAQAGNDVAFIARGRHLAAMRAKGLAIRSVIGDMTIPRPAVTDDPAGLAPADIVLFAVKLWDTESAAKAALPLLAAGGVVVPFQNGVESVERIRKRVPVLCNLKPSGDYVAVDLHRAGGVPQVLKMLLTHGVLHGDCMFGPPAAPGHSKIRCVYSQYSSRDSPL